MIRRVIIEGFWFIKESLFIVVFMITMMVEVMLKVF